MLNKKSEIKPENLQQTTLKQTRIKSEVLKQETLKAAVLKKTELKRGEIFFAELNPVQGSEQGGIRPVLVVQNDIGNNYSPTTIVLPITSRLEKAKLPTHVELSKIDSGLARDSVVLAEQIRTIDKIRLQQKISALDVATMDKVNKAMGISMGFSEQS